MLLKNSTLMAKKNLVFFTNINDVISVRERIAVCFENDTKPIKQANI